MPATRIALVQRLLRATALTPDPTFTPEPRAVADGLWIIDRRASLLGLPDPCTCTVARLDSGDLVLIGAPSFFRPGGVGGRIAAVVAPNSFHHTFVGETLAALDGATFVAAPGLPQRVPTLPPAVELRPDAAPPWSAGLEHVVFGTTNGLSEVLFFHPATRTLILTDLASNVVSFERRHHAWATRAWGIPARFAVSRNARSLLRADRGAAGRTLRRALEWPFERIIVAHGSPVEHDARDAFRAAFAEFL